MPFKKIKRAFKKITKPVAKVLDKVVPNEIKPALPYLAAIAPYMLPAGAGAGLAGIGINNPMLQRAILTGGLNLGSQLAQEGSEGDFSALSLGLAGLQGALTAPGAADTLRGAQTVKGTPFADVALESADATLTGGGVLESAKNIGLEGLATGAEKISGIMSAAKDNPISMAGLKAASIPFTQGSADLGMATARKALQDYEAELAAFNAQAGADQEASDSARRAAIIASMTRADFTQDIIDETLDQLGLKDGGIARLGFDNGGTPVYLDDSLFKDKEYLTLLKDSGRLEDGIKKLIAKEDVPSASKYATLRKLYDETPDKVDKFSKRIDEEVKEKFPDADMGKIDPFDRFPMEVMLIEKILEKQGKTIDDLDEEYGELLEKKGLKEVANKVISDYYSKLEKKSNGGIARLGFDNGGDVDFGGIKEAIKGIAQNNMEEGVTQMYVSDSAGVIPLKAGDAVTGRTMEMMAMGAIEPYGKNDFRDPDGYERFIDIFTKEQDKNKELNAEGMKKGGIASLKDGGIMNLGGKEMDMRTGGFIPIGAKERADDVPARLSKNEFVMTADAVRAAGGGSVNQGAKRMYDLMHNLEARA